MKKEYELPNAIKEAINSSKLAVFIGAGLSRHYGCDSWNDLAIRLVSICEEKNIITKYEKELLLKDKDYKKLITITHSLLTKHKSEKEFYHQMRLALNHFKAKKSKKPKIYTNLLDMGAVTITTNADIWINKYFIKSNIKYKDFSKDTDIHKSYLYKIHGCISDKSSLIFEVDKYLDIYNCESEFTGFLKEIFNNYTVLFVGYGLSEFEIIDYIFKSKMTTKTHYFLKDYYECESNIKEYEQNYYKKMNVQIIPYFKDKNGFDELYNIFKYWKDVIDASTLKALNDSKIIDEILENPYD